MKKLFTILALAWTSFAFADGLPTTPYIYVQGSAETKVDPDTLTISFTTSATDPDQAKAKLAVSEKSALAFKFLEGLGIKDEALTAFDISVQENYDYVANKRTFSGYTVTRNFSVKLTDFALYPKIVNGLVELRIDSLNGAQPSSSKARAASTQLKADALAQARQQADDIAASMGARVVSVFAVSPIEFGEIPRAIFGGNGGAMPMVKTYMASARGDAAGDKYVFDQLTFSERLHVIFLIEPKK